MSRNLFVFALLAGLLAPWPAAHGGGIRYFVPWIQEVSQEEYAAFVERWNETRLAERMRAPARAATPSARSAPPPSTPPKKTGPTYEDIARTNYQPRYVSPSLQNYIDSRNRPAASSSSGPKDVQVRGHWRRTPSGGRTWVDAHTRSRPSR